MDQPTTHRRRLRLRGRHSGNIRDKIASAARNEITEYHIYRNVAAKTKEPANRDLLRKIAEQEKGHYELWTSILGHAVKPSWRRVRLYTILTSIFGLSFTLRLMEKGEGLAQDFYKDIAAEQPEALAIMRDEQVHEEELLKLINERFLQYVSSFVLGINDALVELTGALAGFTLALRDTRLIATVGLITGIAASLSMASAEYLSTREEEGGKNALQAGLMTGVAYSFTVALLVLPYFLITNAIVALAVTLVVAVLIIFTFTFYTSVARGTPFRRRFLEMATISLSVAVLNFFIGFGIKQLLGIDVE